MNKHTSMSTKATSKVTW